MSGPSGAGSVKHYLAGVRDVVSNHGRRGYVAMLRRAGSNEARLVDFECLWLCVSCGYLVEPQLGDPMRPDSRDPETCPACASGGLLDLRNEAMVQQLAELETREPVRSRGMLRALALVCTIGMACTAIYLLIGEFWNLAGIVFIPLAALVAAAIWITSEATRVAARRSTPRRWRLPALPEKPNRLHDVAVGKASSSTELLRAPLSRRPCIAYEVAVGSPESDARPGSWRLLEQRNVACRVGELAIDEDRLVLQLPRERWLSGTPRGDAASSRFLRMRGLLDSERVEIFETILAPGQTCRVGRSSKGTLHARA